MKKLTHTLLAASSLFGAALTTHAQAPKIVVVDIDKIFKQDYETTAEENKLKTQGGQAQKELEGLSKQRQDLVDQAKALQDQGNNPTITADAKTKAQADFQTKAQEVQQKGQEMQNFANNARQALQQDFATFRTQLLDKIEKVALRIAKDHGATIVINSGDHFMEGTPSVLYSDSSYDITDEVMAEVNKDKPANMPAASTDTPAPASSESPSAASSSAPTFSVPNVTPGK